MNEKEIYDSLVEANEQYKERNKFIVTARTKLLESTKNFAESFDYDITHENTFKGNLKYNIKRAIRKSTRFLLKPYAEKNYQYQRLNSEFNGQIFNLLEQQNADIASLKSDIKSIKKVLDDTVQKSLYNGGEITKVKESKLPIEFTSYSQCGEDAIVWFLLNYGHKKPAAFNYLDLGCNHYKNINNTYGFYRMGMSGVLVEANPGFIKELRANRPNDVVLNVGVGDVHEDQRKFYITNNVDMSSFSLESIKEDQKTSPWIQIVREVTVPVLTLEEIIKSYFVSVPAVVSLDVEGLELPILSGLNFDNMRPFIFIIETIDYSENVATAHKRQEIIDFMNSKNYKEYAFTGVNSIFIDSTKI